MANCECHNQGVNPLDPPFVHDKVQEGPSNFSSCSPAVGPPGPPHRKVFVPRLFFGRFRDEDWPHVMENLNF